MCTCRFCLLCQGLVNLFTRSGRYVAFMSGGRGVSLKNRLTKRKGIKKQNGINVVMDLSEGLHRCIDKNCYVINWGGLYRVKL